MTTHRPVRFALLAALLCAAAGMPISAQQPADAIAVALSDPGRVGFVRVNVMNGRIVVRGENRTDVLVTPQSTSGGARGRRQPEPAPPGMQRLTQGAGLTISEANNQISITGPSLTRQEDLEIRVPARTNLNLEGFNGRELVVENVEGDIEVKHVNGTVRLTNVGGSVVADTLNGNVVVLLTRIAGDKAMAFTSFNGNVDVTLPATTKATLKMRSDNGDVFTDFDVQLQPADRQTSVSPGGRSRIQINRAISATINGGGPEYELRTFNGNVYVRRGQ